MRWVFSTKREVDKEDEEIEHLVRESPKNKPPRKDLRKERVDLEKKRDKENDVDLSLNFKDVGGSARYSKKTKYVSVYDKDQDKNVSIPETTQKNNPSRYELIKDKKEGESEEGEGEVSDASKEPDTSKAPKAKTPAKSDSKEPKSDLSAEEEKQLKEFQDGAIEQSKDFKKFVKSQPNLTTDENGKVLYPSREGKEVTFKPFDQLSNKEKIGILKGFDKRQKEVKILSNLNSLSKSNLKFKKVIEELGDSKSELNERLKEYKEQGFSPDEILVSKIFPKEVTKGLAPEVRTLQDLQNAVKAKSKGDGKSNKDKPKKKVITTPTSNKKPPSKERQAEIRRFLFDNFPDDTVSSILQLPPGEVDQFIQEYTKFSKTIDLSKNPELLDAWFSTSPEYIDPPQKVTRPDGTIAPFESLSEKDQNSAWMQHRVETFAMGLAVRYAFKDQMVQAGIDEKEASLVVNSKPKEPPVSLWAKAITTIGAVKEAVFGESSRAKLKAQFDSMVTDAQRKSFAVVNKAKDYLALRALYLEGTVKKAGVEAITESDKPQKVIAKMKNLLKTDKELSSSYPEKYRDVINNADIMLRRITKRLKDVGYQEVSKIEDFVNKVQADDYDTKYKKYLKAKEKVEAENDKIKARAEERGEVPLLNLEPEEPLKPLNYYKVRPTTKEDKKQTEQQVDDVLRNLQACYSIFAKSIVSEMKAKKSVYLGQRPEDRKPRQGWSVVDPSKITDEILDRVYKKALEVLKENTFWTADVSCRSALDIAITLTIPGAVNATLYDALLEKLKQEASVVNRSETKPMVMLAKIRMLKKSCAENGLIDSNVSASFKTIENILQNNQF